MMSKSNGENLKRIFFFSNYLPLQIWTLKFCNHDISKTIKARNSKLGQLIEDEEEIHFTGLTHFLLRHRFLPHQHQNIFSLEDAFIKCVLAGCRWVDPVV